MKVCAIVSEYNPFHNGHKYHIAKTRQAGYDRIVCVMSGNFVQRGDVAIIDKWDRAKTAIKNGADLVVELPTPYVLAPAQIFAKKAVEIANKLGAEAISFGSESGDIEDLYNVCLKLNELKDSPLVKEKLKEGKGLFRAISEITDSEELKSPNNLLGIMYIKAINDLNADMKALTIKRVGAPHDSDISENGYASGSGIRELIKDGEEIGNFIPDYEIKDYADIKKLDSIIMFILRTMSKREMREFFDVKEGLENRIKDKLKTSADTEELINSIKTKRYTHSMLRRIILSMALGIKKEDVQSEIPYIKVLAANEKGIEIVKNYKGDVPISMRAKALECDLLEKESKATDIYNLCFNSPRETGMEYTKTNFK